MYGAVKVPISHTIIVCYNLQTKSDFNLMGFFLLFPDSNE